jgi:amidase
MARRGADVAQPLAVIAGKDPLAPRQDDGPVQSDTAALGRDRRGVRVGLLPEGCGQEGAEPAVEAAVRAAMAAMGA